jgi:hypothetical protein
VSEAKAYQSNRLRISIFLCGIVVALTIVSESYGHAGRRFEVGLRDGEQLFAQGVNTGPSDGAPAVRPFENVIHDHWQNSLLGLPTASATLPGFDIPSPASAIVNRPLYLTLVGSMRWLAPPEMPPPATTPMLIPLGDDELIRVTLGGQTVNTRDLGTLVLTPSVSILGMADLDPLYQIDSTPADVIHVLTFRLSSSNTAVLDSDPIYVILSPDGTNPTDRLHHASLLLESHLSTVAVPEPCGKWLLALGISVLGVVGLRGHRAQSIKFTI